MHQSQDPLPIIDSDRCTGCGICVDTCPTNALSTIDGKAVLVTPDACTYCTACQNVCPEDAIDLPFVIVFAPLRLHRVGDSVKNSL